jgi:hypothetical protein
MKYLGLIVLAVGCGGGNTVKGDVAGAPIEIKSGYFAQEDDVFEGGDGQILIRLSSLDDSCAADVAFSDAAEEADDASDLEELWKANLPEDFWLIDLVLRVGDPDDDLSEKVFDGVAWDEVTDKDDQVFGVLTHYTASLDEEYWDATVGNGAGVDFEDYFEAFYTDGGDLEITGHTASEFIKGKFVTEAATTDDGDTEGQIEIGFSVDRCAEMDQYLFD